MRARAIRIFAAAQGTPHASFNPVHFLEPGFVKRLGSRNLLGRGGGGRLSLGFGAVVVALAATRSALAFLPSAGEGGGAEVLS